MSCDLSACKSGTHEFVEILGVSDAYDTEKVVRWCTVCGSVAVDLDHDNRTSPGRVMKMRSPQVTKD
ncbi:MAG: hypothetical protein MRY49_03550, partial [Candidatus Pacebacteria bacterium]|nr:hypothetical protein [Candidatus Paceibacterota bacterium]